MVANEKFPPDPSVNNAGWPTDPRYLDAILNSLGDGVIATDAAGVIRFMNPMAVTLTGWERSDADGQRLENIFVLVEAESNQPTDRRWVAQVVQQSIPVALESRYHLIRADGHPIPINGTVTPMVDQRGAVIVFRDISPRKALEKALHESLEKFHIIFENTFRWHQYL